MAAVCQEADIADQSTRNYKRLQGLRLWVVLKFEAIGSPQQVDGRHAVVAGIHVRMDDGITVFCRSCAGPFEHANP